MASNCYITFPTTYFAIRAESLLKNGTFPFKMVPVPRVISSSCGTALRCSCEAISEIRQYLLQNSLELEGFYRLEEFGLQTPTIEKLTYRTES
ncbi:MAG: DUF3343 domain-containing protein [Bacillota bacterium]|nr:DUF3343 domain-containing protein [Bacillota bacterium]